MERLFIADVFNKHGGLFKFFTVKAKNEEEALEKATRRVENDPVYTISKITVKAL